MAPRRKSTTTTQSFRNWQITCVGDEGDERSDMIPAPPACADDSKDEAYSDVKYAETHSQQQHTHKINTHMVRKEPVAQ